jgi:hypothetical protein
MCAEQLVKAVGIPDKGSLKRRERAKRRLSDYPRVYGPVFLLSCLALGADRFDKVRDVESTPSIRVSR